MRLYDYASSPNCHKVRILLAQLGRDYERVPIDIFGGDTLKPDFFEKNSGLTTPVLEVEPDVYLPSPERSSSTWPREPTSCPKTASSARRCTAG